MGFIEEVSEDISPRVAVACHFSSWVIPIRIPHFLTHRNLLRNTCHRTDKTAPGKVSMDIQFGIRRMVDYQHWIFADWHWGIPIQTSDMQSLTVRSGFAPNTCYCAGCFYEFREKIDSGHILEGNFPFGSLCNSMHFLIIAFVSVPLCNTNVKIQDSVQ